MNGWQRGWRLLGRHWTFVVVLVLGGVVRVLTDITRLPGVYQDSLIYLRLSEHAPWAPFSPTRPSGYPVALRLIGSMVSGLDAITAAQHLAGLAVATILYVVLIRAGVRRWLAVAAVAVVAFDSFTLALEQDILAETLFTLTLMGSLLLAVRRQGPAAPQHPGDLLGSGLLLAFAITMRTVGLFVIPVWVGWLLLTRCSRRAILAGLVGLAVPILAYASLHAADGVGFNLVHADGWYLYAKVGPIVDCSGASVPAETRPLCVEPVTDDPNFFLYNPGSPAYLLFFDGKPVDLEVGVTPRNNRLLRRFTRAMILANPFEFATVVTRDSVRYFGPAAPPVELSLYGTPGGVMIHYERWLHVRWWMVAGALAASAGALTSERYRRPAALFLGVSLALVVGTSATAAFNIRYVVPVMPFLLVAGVLGIDHGVSRLAEWRTRRRTDTPPPPVGDAQAPIS